MELVCEDLCFYELDELEVTRQAVKKLLDVDWDVLILSHDLRAQLRKLNKMLSAEILKRKEAANA